MTINLMCLLHFSAVGGSDTISFKWYHYPVGPSISIAQSDMLNLGCGNTRRCTTLSDFDSPWKEALEQFFPAFLRFFFPLVHAAINWSREYEALDKDLQQIVREAAVGRRYVDKLFKVWLKDGAEAWVLIMLKSKASATMNSPNGCTA
ncbi:MAG TPA: hypothetical protein VND64_12305, partial [Pirellulales bacterium]|nr:hypothetical protein [Pirellulales bacterium]